MAVDKLIHPDMRFDPNSNPPSFASDDQVRYLVSHNHGELTYPETAQIIEKNTRVRLKIVGTRVDATEIVRRLFHRASSLTSNLVTLVRDRHNKRRSFGSH